METKKIAEAVGEYLMPQLKEISSRLDRVIVRQGEMIKKLDNLLWGQTTILARLDNMAHR